ncbi:Uma2 family endonuclease [Brasilonema sp. UFV-L1]|uniref:Uma2 family endonuclease n=1 Tax=Brasilonema sp. UFV-L1 TaxID=2234130 RepID=UPI00145CC5EA|nr:Uma2 family endonuclease [Brasilonema sp. UFV-L1]NMG10781.1 hypothetical protein [Brasilonema sp. UFV-L1]
MSPETTQAPPNSTTDSLEWQPPMPPTDLIFDDGEPLESNRHRVAMNLLIRSLKYQWAERTDFFVGGNMFVYYSSKQARNRDFKGPDFFVVLDVENDPTRLGWVVWEENGRYPDVIVELLSDSTQAQDLGTKKRLYEQVFKTKDYFVFHPFKVNSLQGWHLDSDKGYQPITANPQGWLWCQTLGLWVGTWNGLVENDDTAWLRFYDEAGNVVLLPEEAQQQRANQEQQRADAQQQQANQERQARLNAVPQLLEMGLSVEQIAQALSLTVVEVEEMRRQ